MAADVDVLPAGDVLRPAIVCNHDFADDAAETSVCVILCELVRHSQVRRAGCRLLLLLMLLKEPPQLRSLSAIGRH